MQKIDYLNTYLTIYFFMATKMDSLVPDQAGSVINNGFRDHDTYFRISDPLELFIDPEHCRNSVGVGNKRR
jgi:hypothetical protein